MSDTMLAAVLIERGRIEVREVALPIVASDEVLVRIESVGVCGSDAHYFHEGRIGDFVVNRPLILGHEASGTIVEVGDGVSPSRLGERVAIEPQRACRMCPQCKQGRYNLCLRMEFYGTPPIDGAFAQFQTIQADYAFPVPDNLSWDAAALCEPLSVAIWSNQKAGTTWGSRILIAGAGPVGMLCGEVALALGASDVVISDPSEERRARASQRGVLRLIDPRERPLEELELDVDSFIDASGAQPALRSGILSVRAGGSVVLVGMGAAEVALPVARIQARELSLTGVFRYANTWPQAIEMASSGAVDLDSLVTERFGLSDVGEALEISSRPTSMKVIVKPNE